MDWSRGHAIGRGSSATVSVATSGSGDIFAVKSIELPQSEFLQREQQFLSSLCHPYVVTYKGCDITRENNTFMYNLSMEYMSGGTLSDAVCDKGGRLDEALMGYYTSQMLQGLDYLHSRGIVHCDIKGRNVLIGEKGAKIADLGCAKWNNPGTGHTTAAVPIGGTPMFMAPEVARGEDQGFPADTWALGCTVIEMATGRPPWPIVNDPMSVLYRIAFSGELPEFPDFLSSQARDFLSKCLRRDPKERWTAKQLLKHPFLEEFISPEKQSQDINTSSPTSILDQGIWNSMEELEILGGIVNTNSLNSPASRIGKLSAESGLPNWKWEETWITIRRNEAVALCGSVRTLVGDEVDADDMEVESTVNVGEAEELISCLGSYGSCSNSCSNLLMACTCVEHSDVMGSLNLERHKDEQVL
ncbi:hypothetical protein RJ639_028699 [Escallonia herrerae]|uniref:mitogen-activated protein kinase kinase kinase n=1 Tax=Escallonia herrerae TaxID=1293975 RepID=A0AA88XDT0_9ASTE|nr:hypothetical protein RJ639_028699 [Escallonia herrerae]